MKLKFKRIFASLLIAIFIFPGIASAAIVSCGLYQVKHVYVQSSRDDNHVHSNMLMIELDGPDCNGSKLIYLENTNPAYESMVYTAMQAFTNNMYIDVYVNSNVATSAATQIAALVYHK